MRWVDWYGDGSLWVADIALACCALEFEAAAPVPGTSLPDALPASARVVVVISGTVTDRLASVVVALVERAAALTGRRPQVVSFGACASSGGPYWDSPVVCKGADQLVPVDVYVPGCPPPPQALRAVIDQLAGRVPA